MILTGYRPCTCAADNCDIQFCKQYTAEKPVPVPLEFLDVAEILLRENGWSRPENCDNALDLYMDLVNILR